MNQRNITIHEKFEKSDPVMTSIVLFLLFSFIAGAEAQQGTSNISLDSSLSLTGDNIYWLSPSNHFAFGFYPKGNGFAVGIWLNLTSQKTVVWTANRDDPPIPSNAVLNLTADGRLVLQQDGNQEKSIVNALKPAAFVSMLDSGNFVLYAADSSVIWQSFDHPTDTLLPGQVLRPLNHLVSSVSETDHSSGSFVLVMQHDGKLVMYPADKISVQTAYWGTRKANTGNNVTLKLDADGHLFLLNSIGTGTNIWNKTEAGSSSKTYRLTLDADGVLRLYSLNLAPNLDWSIEWWSTDDCSYKAAGFQNQNWRKQKLSLIKSGRRVRNSTLCSATLVNEGEEGTKAVENTSSKSVQRKETRKLSISFSIVSIAFITFAFVALVLILKVRGFQLHNQISDGRKGELTEPFRLKSFTYKELHKATNGFAKELGVGVLRKVFKGVLQSDQRVIAVQELENVVAEDEVGFRDAFYLVGQINHRNVVRLLGYFHDKSNRFLVFPQLKKIFLVYEYVKTGSLADFLFKSKTKPNWKERIHIATQIAEGVNYMHEGGFEEIIHYDINPNNILMDEHCIPKIAHFGLPILNMHKQRKVRRTKGYVAPEFYKNQKITAKEDVYSFGIVLLEIICCRRSVSMEVPEDETVLAEWVCSCFEANELNKLDCAGEVDQQTLHRMVSIALWCIQIEPSQRPSMIEVFSMLKCPIQVPVPPTATSLSSLCKLLYSFSENENGASYEKLKKT